MRALLRTNNLTTASINNFVIFLITSILALRMFRFVNDLAVNLLFSDHWTYLKPLFEEQGLWSWFTHQHGPHRQGLGLVISGLIMNFSNWNTNIDSQSMVITLTITSLILLSLSIRLQGRLYYSDIIIPVLVLSPLHYETIITAPNSSHSIFPLLLIAIAAHTFVGQTNFYKILAQVFIGFLLLFTGFGIFAGILLLLTVIFSSIKGLINNDSNITNLFLIFASIISIAVFLFEYKIPVSGAEFSLNAPTTVLHLKFMAYHWSGLFQIREPYAFSVGLILLAITIVTTSYLIIKSLSGLNSIEKISLFFLTASLSYSLMLTIGRIETTANFAQGSRYMALLVPAAIAGRLLLQFNKNIFFIVTLWVLMILSLTALRLDTIHTEIANGFQSMKNRLRTAYTPDRTLNDIEVISGVNWLGASQDKIDILRRRKLHFTEN